MRSPWDKRRGATHASPPRGSAVAERRTARYPCLMSSLIRLEPASADRWDDLERLFGARGACGGCWCMWYRLPRAEYERQKGAGNREELRRLLGAGQPVGVIAYAGEEPIGWCAVAPRAAFTRWNERAPSQPCSPTPVSLRPFSPPASPRSPSPSRLIMRRFVDTE